MGKSKYVAALDGIQKAVTPVLAPLGFQKFGRTYNRRAADEIVHVIHFQMGQYPIGNYDIPGIRENKYGEFTVNLGVFFPCPAAIENRQPKKTVQEYLCQIRARLGSLVKGIDLWWPLGKADQKTSQKIYDHLTETGLPFLSRFSSNSAILAYFQANGYFPGATKGRSALLAAMICHCLGDGQNAAEYLNQAKMSARRKNHPGFAAYVEEIEAKCSFSED